MRWPFCGEDEMVDQEMGQRKWMRKLEIGDWKLEIVMEVVSEGKNCARKWTISETTKGEKLKRGLRKEHARRKMKKKKRANR